jgi:subtilase family serine protease
MGWIHDQAPLNHHWHVARGPVKFTLRPVLPITCRQSLGETASAAFNLSFQPMGSSGLRARVVASIITAVSILVASYGSGSTVATRISGATVHLPTGAIADCLARSHCYTPRIFRVAYGIQPLLARGIDGRGETVVLVEIAAPPLSPPKSTDIHQDLALFDSIFDLPPVRLQVVTRLAGSASSQLANLEEVEDTELVHAVAPDATIRVILIGATAEADPGNLIAALSAAFGLGLSQGAVISISASFGEHCFTPVEVARLHSTLKAAQDHHVTVISSSGDFGVVSKPCPGSTSFSPVKEVGLPDSDPLVLGVGGTSLTANRASGAYVGETAWNIPPTPPQLTHSDASGGGFSHLFTRPSYQDGVTGIGAARGVPDVAADASPYTGMALTVTEGGQKYIVATAGGTSAGAPFWAGLIALADQYAGRNLGFVNAGIYRIGRSDSYDRAFHDITRGTNTVKFPTKTIGGYRASHGWDPVTGWGSPNAQALVPLLARYVKS